MYYNDRHLTKEFEEKAKAELNELDGNREECWNEIERWALDKYQLKFRIGDLWLLNTLRSCKFNANSAKKKLEAYLNLKCVAPEMFGNRDPALAHIQELLNKSALISFGTPDQDCILIRWGVLEPHVTKISDVLKLSSMLLDVYLNESETCMLVGQHVIIDLEGFTGFMKQLTPRFLKNVFCDFFNAYPCRIKGLYMINTTKLLEKTLKFAKLFMSENMASTTHAFGMNYNELFSIIPQEYFPREYGGSCTSVDELADVLKENLGRNRKWFLDNPLHTTHSGDNLKRRRSQTMLHNFYNLF
ncbi:hypothetical protein PPYR_14425 [Photinus pyralis]|uniref:CRAL-TRIO domain-containing protein n=1 Tax=Photinus pyralis TaxID=7054 RepID=A0A5N4A556_PHOPY|nr:retinol-binding protein pinta-like [Photinus pyralis]KAB0792466.1 hypothetical protein PPYR_14425 [Photinus pyralis]